MHGDPPTWEAFAGGWELFRDPLLFALTAGVVLGFLGVYVVLRRMVFVSAAVTQSAGLGVALSFYAEIHLGWHVDAVTGAAVFALLTMLLLTTEPRRTRLPRDVLLGVAFAGTGGAAVLVGDRIAQEAHDIQSILFGSAVLVRTVDLWMVAVAGATFLALHVWWYRGIVFTIFDRDAARVQGLPVRLLGGFVFLSVGAMVGLAARALGALPVFAFSVLPAATALALRVPLPWTLPVAGALGGLSGVGGYLLAFFLQFPVGASQTVLASALLVLALALRAARGLAGARA